MTTPTEKTGPDDVRRPLGGEQLGPLLLTAPQAAALCGKSVRTWRCWNATGRIPRAIRIGRSIAWRRKELEAWVDAGCPDRLTWETIQKT